MSVRRRMLIATMLSNDTNATLPSLFSTNKSKGGACLAQMVERVTLDHGAGNLKPLWGVEIA